MRGVLLANGGVLLVLVFGPNAEHRMLPVAYAGAVIAVGGAVLIVRNALARRRSIPPAKGV